MRVLMIDDERWRFETFLSIKAIPEDTVFVSDALTGIDKIVNDGPWDKIFLDHDLATFIQDPYKREITGADVANVIVNQSFVPMVIVHSMNPAGAINICNILKDNNIPHIRKPLSDFLG